MESCGGEVLLLPGEPSASQWWTGARLESCRDPRAKATELPAVDPLVGTLCKRHYVPRPWLQIQTP